MENQKTILTGLRPTGKLHVGHYFGAITNWVKLQEEYNSYFEIADVQALTDNFNNPEKVRINVREVAIDLLSVGIDPSKATIFIQSMIPEIAELTVYYSNFVTIARLYRNPTVKFEASHKKEIFGDSDETITYGFLGYPVSQAADITVFDGSLIPVGDDQLPILEQTREIVRKFNKVYDNILIEPEPLLSAFPRIKGLDGNEKMGKSLGNAVYLADSEAEVTKKIMAAITDPNKSKKNDPAEPEICMVYYYHKLVADGNLETVEGECKTGSRGCVDCKRELICNMMKFLKPIQEKRKYYEENPEVIDKVLKEGTERARTKAIEVMAKIRKNMKLNYFE